MFVSPDTIAHFKCGLSLASNSIFPFTYVATVLVFVTVILYTWHIAWLLSSKQLPCVPITALCITSSN